MSDRRTNYLHQACVAKPCDDAFDKADCAEIGQQHRSCVRDNSAALGNTITRPQLVFFRGRELLLSGLRTLYRPVIINRITEVIVTLSKRETLGLCQRLFP